MPVAGDAISTLNSLIAEVRCSITLYGEARSQPAIGARSSLSQGIGRLEAIVDALTAELRRLGGVPEENDKSVEPIQPAAPDDAEVIAEGHHPLLEQIERQDRHLLARMEAALADRSLSDTTRDVLGKACLSVRSDCQTAHALNRGESFGVGIPGLV